MYREGDWERSMVSRDRGLGGSGGARGLGGEPRVNSKTILLVKTRGKRWRVGVTASRNEFGLEGRDTTLGF